MASFIENLFGNKISRQEFLRERTISSMDCNEYKEKIYPETPRIKPQKTPEIPLLELTLPPIKEEQCEEDFGDYRTCYFSLDKQMPQLDEETSVENDTISTISCTQSLLNFASKSEQLTQSQLDTPTSLWHSKSALMWKKSKSMKLEQQKRNRAASVALPRFSIYNFLKKIIRKSKQNKF